MANSNSCAALENDQRVEAAVHEEDAAAELACSSERNLPEDHAAGELACAYITERSDVRKNNPREENGAAVLVQEDADLGPTLSSSDSSSDVQKGTVPEKGAAPDIPRSSMDRSSEANNAHEDAVKGIASVLGPVMNHFDSAVEGALKSQSILTTSIDRLTRELDKLLEDVPIPFATHHATRLSGIRKRVLTLNTSLSIIHRRMETIQRSLAGYASKAAAKGNKERFFMENSNSVPHGQSPPEGDALSEAMSKSSAGAPEQEDGGPSIHSETRRQKHHDDPEA